MIKGIYHCACKNKQTNFCFEHNTVNISKEQMKKIKEFVGIKNEKNKSRGRNPNYIVADFLGVKVLRKK